jgi:hypothetical protein
VLEELYAGRARAFAAADEAALAAVYAPSRPGGASDARLCAHGGGGADGEGRAPPRDGGRPSSRVDADRAELRVVDSPLPTDVRDAAGQVVARQPGRGEAVQGVELCAPTPGGGSWTCSPAEALQRGAQGRVEVVVGEGEAAALQDCRGQPLAR